MEMSGRKVTGTLKRDGKTSYRGECGREVEWLLIVYALLVSLSLSRGGLFRVALWSHILLRFYTLCYCRAHPAFPKNATPPPVAGNVSAPLYIEV